MTTFSDELPPFIDIIYDIQTDHYLIGSRSTTLDSWHVLQEEDLREFYSFWKKIASLRPTRRQIA